MMQKSIITTLLLISSICFFSCQSTSPKKVKFEQPIVAVEDLVKHSEEFNQAQVIKVKEGIHVAVGFGLANSILIEGENGNIIVDCLESNGVAEKVKAAFNKISDKPIKAIIYTHNHVDHIFGSGVMAGDDQPDVYAHELTNYYINHLVSVVQPVIGLRSNRMFGLLLDSTAHINCGIGMIVDANEQTQRSLLRPTVTFEDELEVEIEGVKLKMVHAPGETADQIFVWLPEEKVLLPGDNLYKAFPNLYTIRGTPYRDVNEWVNSLDKMRYLQPEILVPSHTQPILGAEKVQSALQDYRDGIQFIHDQTIRYANQGHTPDELVELVKLPPHLSQSPYLKEFYGRVDWSVRNTFTGYLGFFDGNASTLAPLPVLEKAQKMADLAGGQDQLAKQAQTALDTKEYQWALELSDYLIRLKPEEEQVKSIRYESLIGLAEQQSNPNARNYYLSQALEVKGQSMHMPLEKNAAIAHTVPLENIFQAVRVNLMAEQCLDYDKKAVFHFTDIDKYWTIHIRRGIAETQAFAMTEPDFEIEMTSFLWKEILAEIRSPFKAFATGEIKVKSGGVAGFATFMRKFERN